MSDTDVDGIERTASYLLGNASGLGISIEIAAIALQSWVLGVFATIMVGSTFMMFRTYPWQSLHTDTDQ